MSLGQIPFNATYQNNTLGAINVLSEETANENDSITFVKGGSGTGRKLYINSGLTFNPQTKTLTSTNVSINSLLFPDTTTFFKVADFTITNAQGRISFTPTARITPINLGTVVLSYDGSIFLGQSASSKFGISDQTTSDYFWLFSNGGFLQITANGNQVFNITNTGILSLTGTSAGLSLYDRSISTNYFNIYSTGSVLTLTYNGTSLGTIGTTGITTLVPQKIQTTAQATGTFYLSFAPLSSTQTAGQVLSVHSGLSYNVATSTITATNFNGSLNGPATLIDNTLQTTGVQFLTMLPLSATTSAGQVVGTHAPLSYNVASSTLNAVNLSGTQITLGGTQIINVSASRTSFTGGNGISVASGISIGTAYATNGIVGISGIMNSLTSTNFFQIYDNAVANILFQMNSIRTRSSLPLYLGTIDGYTGSSVPLAMLNNILTDGQYNNIQLGFSSSVNNSWFVGARYNTTALNTIFSISPYGTAQDAHFYITGSGITSSTIIEGRNRLQTLDITTGDNTSYYTNNGFITVQDGGVVQGGWYSNRVAGFLPLAGTFGFQIGNGTNGAQLILADVPTAQWGVITSGYSYSIYQDFFGAGGTSSWGIMYSMSRLGRNVFNTNNYQALPTDYPILNCDSLPLVWTAGVPNTLTGYVNIARTTGNSYTVSVPVNGNNQFGRSITISFNVAFNFILTATASATFPTTLATGGFSYTLGSQSATINGSAYTGYTFTTTNTSVGFQFNQSAVSQWNIIQPVGQTTITFTPTNTGNDIDNYVFTISYNRTAPSGTGISVAINTAVNPAFIVPNLQTTYSATRVSGTGTLTPSANPTTTLLTTTRTGASSGLQIDTGVQVNATAIQTALLPSTGTYYPLWCDNYSTTTNNIPYTDNARNMTYDVVNGNINVNNMNVLLLNNQIGSSIIAPAGEMYLVNCFTTSFKNYDIYIRITNTLCAGTYLFFDLATSGSVRLGATWKTQTSYLNGTTPVNVSTPTASCYVAIIPNTTGGSFYKITLYNPFVSGSVKGVQATNNYGYLTSTTQTQFNTAGINTNTTNSYPSFYFGAGTGTTALNGTIYINGFN